MMRSHAEWRACDATYRQLADDRDQWGNRLDASNDGARDPLPHWVIQVMYERAVRAFHSYRRAIGADVVTTYPIGV